MTWRPSLVLVGILVASPRAIREEPMDVAALNLACRPVLGGAECRLLALVPNATRPARDVTGWASWRADGSAQMCLTPVGAIRVSGRGDVVIDTRYQSNTAHAIVRLTPDLPAQLLAILRGTVYASDLGTLRPLANARVEVVSGPTLGPRTTTHRDGTYELTAVIPGHIVIRATKTGFIGTDLAVKILPGDNKVNPVLFVEPRTAERPTRSARGGEGSPMRERTRT